MSEIRGVLLDWRGTLVVAPTYPWLVRTALERAGRPSGDVQVHEVLSRLRSADATAVESSEVDTDADLHRAAHMAWFREAGVDDDLAETLYAVESDVALNPFVDDVGDLLALDRLGLAARDVLMVGDRGSWDGAATDLGMTTLLLPPLNRPDERRLHRVLRLLD